MSRETDNVVDFCLYHARKKGPPLPPRGPSTAATERPLLVPFPFLVPIPVPIMWFAGWAMIAGRQEPVETGSHSCCAIPTAKPSAD